MQQFYTNQLFSMVPPELENPLKNVLKLAFNEQPNYKELKDTFQFLLRRELELKRGASAGQASVTLYHEFEWVQNQASFLKKSLVS